MFSNWIQAVENLAQHSPKSSQDLSAEAHQTRPSLEKSRRGSQSSITQRSASPAGRPADGAPRPRTTLEDRIRAKLAATASSETVSSSMTSTSLTGKSSPAAILDRPGSPASTPLPDSPALPSVTIADPRKTRSQSPVVSLNGKSDAGSEARPSAPTKSQHAHAASVDVVWHPLSPTSTPLPDSMPSSPDAGPSGSATDISIHNLVSEASLSESPDSIGGPSAADAPVETTSNAAPSPTSTVNLDSVQTPDLGMPTSGPNQELHTVADVVSAESQPSDAEPTEEPATEAHEQSNAADPTPVEDREIQFPIVDNPPQELTLIPVEEPQPSSPPTSADDPAQRPASSQTREPESTTEVVTTDTRTDTTQPSSVAAGDRMETASQDHPAQVLVLQGQDAIEQEQSADTPHTIPLSLSSTPLPTSTHNDGLVEGLQKRLKLVEQRFADVSTSFKRLQAEKIAADKILQEFTPLQSVQEVESLRDYLQNMSMKTEMAQDEIKRVTGKLTRQEERIEELRDTHRLESKSQTEQIDKLKAQIDETEALLKATQGSTTRAEEEAMKQKIETEHLKKDVERMKGNVKDEEEKRVKAVGLLKTVRQKLVKAEKERDDALKEVQSVKDRDKAELDKERAEKADLRREIERMNAERETALNGLKAHFDREVSALKEKHEKELAAMKSQFELEAITTKSSLARDLENKGSRIVDLEGLVRALESEKDEFFDQLQLRQAELESSRSRLESLEGQTTEFQYQLREANDRIALLTEELSDARREQESKALNIGPSAEEVSRLLSAAEGKYESRISDLRNRLNTIEREREEGDALWSRKLADKSRELDSLKDILNSSARSREQQSENVQTLKEEIDRLKEEVMASQLRISDMRTQADYAMETENGLKSQVADLTARVSALQQLVEDGKARESQLRMHNKTMREELLKVQSSAALLERQRNPGVGYWASRQDLNGDKSPRSSIDGRDSPSRPGSPALSQSDEEINVEYLRNVILQFLEHKEMRPHLVRILSTILRFTPQETRRLVSKV